MKLLNFALCLNLLIGGVFPSFSIPNASSHVVGYNIYVDDISVDRSTSSSSSSISFSPSGSGTNMIDIDGFLSSTTSSSTHSYLYIDGAKLRDNLRFSGTITNNNTSSTYYAYTVKVDVILDNNYYGSITGSLNNQSQTAYFNGNTCSFNFDLSGNSVSIPVSFSFSSFNLLANPQGLNISVDSLASLSPLFNNFDFVNLFNFDGFAYPFFNSNTTSPIVNYNLSTFSNSWVLIMMCNYRVSSLNAFNNLFDYPTDKFTVSFDRWNCSENFNVYKATFTKIDTSVAITNLTVKFKRADVPFTVVYSDYLRSSYNVSTDFALQFRLNNQLLNDLHILSNGTDVSNSASQSAQNSISEFSQKTGELDNLENSFSNNLNNSLNSVSLTSPSSFGSSFLTSASWVTDRFNSLTSSTPFGSLLGFILSVSLALYIVGLSKKGGN